MWGWSVEGKDSSLLELRGDERLAKLGPVSTLQPEGLGSQASMVAPWPGLSMSNQV